MRKHLGALALGVILAAAGSAQPSFKTPEQAVQALAKAVSADGDKLLFGLFGPQLEKLLDPVPQGRKESRRVLRLLLKERWKVSDLEEGRKIVRLGNEGWPFPVTLAKTAEGWKFDTESGIEEVLNRRIGNNELINIETLTCLMLAEEDYRSVDRDKNGIREYTSRVDSSANNKRDGLYWKALPNQPLSPLEGALKESARYAVDRVKGAPWWGYRYRFLNGQGSAAPGGAYDYRVNGYQVAGWAVVAYPATYKSSGIKTFICNQDGTIYEKDLGSDSARQAQEMTLFDPGDGWIPLDEQDLAR